MPKKKSHSKPTIKDIAKQAGVSAATVSIVLRNRQTSRASSETQQKILEIAQKLKYRPNVIARALAGNETKLIGLIIPTLLNPFYAEFANAIIESAIEKKLNVIARSTRNDVSDEKQAIYDLLDHGVDGLIICSALRKDAIVYELNRLSHPFVLVMRNTEIPPGMAPIDYVGVDNRKGAYLAVEHLLKLGHRKIGLFTGPQEVSTGFDRKRGAIDALKTFDLAPEKAFIFNTDFNRRSGYVQAVRMLESRRRPTAVFAAGDYIAIGIIEAIRESGLRVPEDIAVVGFNDVEIASIPGIDLTTVSHKISIMGKLGVDHLVDKISGISKGVSKKTLLEPVLVIRKSCGFHLQKGG